MPTINKRFLLILVLAAAAGSGLLAGVHTLQAGRIPGALLRQADRAAEQDKSEEAVRYLRQYLEFRPDDTDARVRLAGLLKARPGFDPADLLLLYEKILRADPARADVRRDALDTALKIGRFTDAEGHADTLLKLAPTDPDLWLRRAAAQAGLRQTAEARQSFEAAITHGPARLEPYREYARYLQLDLRLPREALAVTDRLVAALPNDPAAYLTRVDIARRADELGGVSADLRKALALDPANADATLLLAEQEQRARDLTAARDRLAAGMKAHPDDVRFVRSLAWLELYRGNAAAAVAVLEDGLGRVKDGADLLLSLAELLVQAGETGRTEEIVAKLAARPGPDARRQANYLRARLAMRRADWPEATVLLTDLRTDAVGLPILEAQTTLLLAVCYQRQGDTAREQDALKLLLNRDPNHTAARVELAETYLNLGQTADAMREYELASQSPAAGPTTHAALLRFKARELRLAGGGRPDDWQQLDRVATELAKASPPASPDPVLLRADLAEARGDMMKAAAILKEALAKRPNDAILWTALASRVADLAGTAAGFGVLDEAQAAAGDGPDIRLARADLAARDPARGRPVDSLAGQLDDWPELDQTRVLFGLVEVYDRLGDDARVVQTYQRLAARRPTDLGVWEPLGERAARTGNTAAFADAKAKAVALDPTGRTAALFDAWAALAGKDLAAARAATDGLVKAFGPVPNRAEACLALARLKQLAGDSADVGKLYERAVRLEPVRYPPIQAYLAHLAASGDDAAAVAVVARLARDPRWAGEPFRRAIRGAVRLAPPDAGTRLVAAARPYIDGEPGGLGWVGDAYFLAGARGDAAACYEKAIAARSATPDDWLRFAVRMGEGGSPANAVKVVEAARTRLTPPAFFATAAAFASSAAASKGWAPALADAAERKQYAQARLSLLLSQNARSEAIALLEQFLADSPPPAADAAWARRNTATLLAARGGPGDRAKAVALLLADDGDAKISADDRRSTAAVLTALARYLDGPERVAVLDRATKALERVVTETAAPRDAYLLVQLYRTNKNPAAFRSVLNQLLDKDPKNLDYYLLALDELSESGTVADAEPFAKRLRELSPNDFRAVAAVARFECRAGRAADALKFVEAYARGADAPAGERPGRAARAADLLDDLARRPNVRRTDVGHAMVRSAVDKYEVLIASRPEKVAAAAGLLADDGRAADGFALIDRHGKPLSARVKAAAGLAVLRAGGGSDRQFALVRQWLDAAAAADPDAAAVHLDEGEFYALRQDYPKAEAAFLAVLAKDPKNVFALNNLAWVLAPRPETAARAIELVDRAIAEVGVRGELLDTRARARIAAKQFDLGEKDSLEALSREKTPLRLFHLALAKQGRTPPQPADAQDAFRRAKDRGLDAQLVHPADLPMYRVFEAETRPPG